MGLMNKKMNKKIKQMLIRGKGFSKNKYYIAKAYKVKVIAKIWCE